MTGKKLSIETGDPYFDAEDERAHCARCCEDIVGKLSRFYSAPRLRVFIRDVQDGRYDRGVRGRAKAEWLARPASTHFRCTITPLDVS